MASDISDNHMMRLQKSPVASDIPDNRIMRQKLRVNYVRQRTSSL